MPKLGIDISVWQKGFNFDKAKAEGVEFAILRGAYHLSKDTCFEGFYEACKARNIPVGVYHYSMAKSVAEAKQEANFLISNVLKGKRFEYPVYIDVEDKTQRVLGRSLLTDIVVAFCETIENAGYYVGIYSSMAFFGDHLDESRLLRFDKWIAQWSRSCNYSGSFGLWQFGGETNLLRENKVAGVVCDQDYAYKDYPAIMIEKGLNGYAKGKVETETVKTKSLAELAEEVIGGVWGNGETRKIALTEAGYDYAAVQDKVNEILDKKTLDELAREVIAGKWGNGAERKRRLTQAGYDWLKVQERVNKMLS